MTATDFFETVEENYGVDPDGPNAVDNEEHVGRISIPQTTLKFSEADNSLLRQNVDPLTKLWDRTL